MINTKNRMVKVSVLLHQYQKSIWYWYCNPFLKFILVLVLAIHFARCVGIDIAKELLTTLLTAKFFKCRWHECDGLPKK